jgi:hypothetical protein
LHFIGFVVCGEKYGMAAISIRLKRIKKIKLEVLRIIRSKKGKGI